MPKVKFVNEKVTVDANPGEDLRTVARKNGVQLYSGPHKIVNCMGMGTCCSCNVIIAKGNHVQHYMNGKLVLDFTDNEPSLTLLEGVLAVQLHAGKPMWAEFKSIRIKELK